MITKLWTFIVVIVVGVVTSLSNSKPGVTPSPQPSISPTPSTSSLPSPLPKQDKLLVSSPTPVPVKVTSTDWVYPGATSIGANKWQSSDSPQAITNWYKDKIKALGMNAQSFVQTNTNDNVLNKLVAANGTDRVSVEISKSASDSQTSISIVLDK